MERVRRNGTNMLENLEMACLMEMEHIFPMMEAGMMKYFILKMKFLPYLSYIGEFSGGQKHGKGVMYYTNGESRQGTWSNNKLIGR